MLLENISPCKEDDIFTMCCSLTPHHVLLVKLCPPLPVNTSSCVGCERISLCCMWKPYPVLPVYTLQHVAGEGFTLCCWWKLHPMLLVYTLSCVAIEHFTLCCRWPPTFVLVVSEPSCDAGRFTFMMLIEVWLDDQLLHIIILCVTWSIVYNMVRICDMPIYQIFVLKIICYFPSQGK